MASSNEAVAALLREYAELLAITGGDPFRARNYEKVDSSAPLTWERLLRFL